MNQPDDQNKRSEPLKSKPSRLEEARRIAEEYAADLREIVRKLRERLLH